MRVAVIDYGSGNLRSVLQALHRACADYDIKAEISLVSDAQTVRHAHCIILPGVGAYADCRRGLQAIAGMEASLKEAVLAQGKPFLGICVGMQLLSDYGFEKGKTLGLGWIGGNVTLLEPKDKRLKVPHIGWNELKQVRSHPLFDGIGGRRQDNHAYFVHSYHFNCQNEQDIIAYTDYDGEITATIGRDNIVGTQFHPEKSQALGLRILANFLRWRP